MKRIILYTLGVFFLFSITGSFAQKVSQGRNHGQGQEASGNFTVIAPSFLEDYIRKIQYTGSGKGKGRNLVFISTDPSHVFTIFEKSDAEVALGFSPLPEKKTSRKVEILKNPSRPDILSVQMGSLAVLVLKNSSNPLKGLTINQFDAIFSSTRTCGYPFEITKWGELGLSGPWTSQPIHLTGLPRESLISGLLRKMALCGGKFKDGIAEQVDSEDVASAVSRDKRALGFCSTVNTGEKASALPIAPQEGALYFLPTDDNILTGDYPLSRAVYVFLKLDDGRKMSAEQGFFLKKILAEKGQRMLHDYGMVPAYSKGYKKGIKHLLKIVQNRDKGKNHK